jgi:hypothetical protein
VGPARMIAESLTPKPGIREQNLPQLAMSRKKRTRPPLADIDVLVDIGGVENERVEAGAIHHATCLSASRDPQRVTAT